MERTLSGKVEQSDIEDALKGTQLSQNNSSILHTLGCVYAEAGKTKEGEKCWCRPWMCSASTSPIANYWYAFGRIAEQYGEREAALANYARVTKPERATQIPDSAYYLSRVRMQTLRGEK